MDDAIRGRKEPRPARPAVPFIHRIVKVPDIVIILLFGEMSWIILTLRA